jgi:hypothetical protein
MFSAQSKDAPRMLYSAVVCGKDASTRNLAGIHSDRSDTCLELGSPDPFTFRGGIRELKLW